VYPKFLEEETVGHKIVLWAYGLDEWDPIAKRRVRMVVIFGPNHVKVGEMTLRSFERVFRVKGFGLGSVCFTASKNHPGNCTYEPVTPRGCRLGMRSRSVH
jgi:hypothetical protein